MPTPYEDPEIEARAYFAENEGVFTAPNLESLNGFTEEILEDFETLEDVKRLPRLSKEQIERLVSMRHNLKKTATEIKNISAANLNISSRVPLTLSESDKKILATNKALLSAAVKEVLVAACASRIPVSEIIKFAEKFDLKDFNAVTNKEGLNPLCAAVLGNRNAEDMKYFLTKCDINAKLANGNHIGHFAVLIGADKEMLKLLLQAKPPLDKNAENNFGLTMLDMVALRGNKALFEELQGEEFGLQVGSKMRNRATPQKADRGRERVKGRAEGEEQENSADKIKQEAAKKIAEQNAEKMAQEALRIQQAMDALATHEEQRDAAILAMRKAVKEAQEIKLQGEEELRVLLEKNVKQETELKTQQEKILDEQQLVAQKELLAQASQLKDKNIEEQKETEQSSKEITPQNTEEKEEQKEQPKPKLDVLQKLLNGDLEEMLTPRELGEFLIDAVLEGKSMIAASLITMGASVDFQRDGKSALEHMVRGNQAMQGIASIKASQIHIEQAIAKTLPATFLATSEITKNFNREDSLSNKSKTLSKIEATEKTPMKTSEENLNDKHAQISSQSPSTVCLVREEAIKLDNVLLSKTR